MQPTVDTILDITPNIQIRFLITLCPNYVDLYQFLKFLQHFTSLLPSCAAEQEDNHIHSPYL